MGECLCFGPGPGDAETVLPRSFIFMGTCKDNLSITMQYTSSLFHIKPVGIMSADHLGKQLVHICQS